MKPLTFMFVFMSSVLLVTFGLITISIDPHSQYLWEAIALIPNDANVSTEGMMISQLSSRENINYFPWKYHSFEYVLLDTTRESHASYLRPELLEEVTSNKDFQLLFMKDGIFLFKNHNIGDEDTSR